MVLSYFYGRATNTRIFPCVKQGHRKGHLVSWKLGSDEGYGGQKNGGSTLKPREPRTFHWICASACPKRAQTSKTESGTFARTQDLLRRSFSLRSLLSDVSSFQGYPRRVGHFLFRTRSRIAGTKFKRRTQDLPSDHPDKFTTSLPETLRGCRRQTQHSFKGQQNRYGVPDSGGRTVELSRTTT